MHKPLLFVHLYSQRCLSSFESIAIYKIKMNLIQFIPQPSFRHCNWFYTSSLWISEQHPSLRAGQTQRLQEECATSEATCAQYLFSTSISTVASGRDSRFLFLIKLQPTHLSGSAGKYCGMWYEPQLFFSWNRAYSLVSFIVKLMHWAIPKGCFTFSLSSCRMSLSLNKAPGAKWEKWKNLLSLNLGLARFSV